MRKFFWLSIAGCILLPSAVFATVPSDHRTGDVRQHASQAFAFEQARHPDSVLIARR